MILEPKTLRTIVKYQTFIKPVLFPKMSLLLEMNLDYAETSGARYFLFAENELQINIKRMKRAGYGDDGNV